MADVMWLQLGATKLILDSSAVSVNLPDVQRDYSAVPLFNNKQNIYGSGAIIPGTISYDLYFRKGTSTNVFTADRNTLMSWMTIDKSQLLYFYIVINGKTLYARVYPHSKSGENYNNYKVSASITFSFIMETAYFIDSALTINSFTLTTNPQTITVTNGGTVSYYPIITWTPSSLSTIFQANIYTNYGIRYEYTFSAANAVVIDCGTGVMTIAGVVIGNAQTGGNVFYLPSGSNSVIISAGAGSLTINGYERYV